MARLGGGPFASDGDASTPLRVEVLADGSAGAATSRQVE